MKILRLNSVAGPPGGVEAYIEGVDRILSKYGHETRTITLTTGVRREKSVNEIEIVSPPSPLTRAINDVIPSDEVYEALLSEYRTFRPDLIHLHHLRIGFASVVRFLRSVEEPVVFTAHDALAVCPLSTLVKPGNVICEGGASVRCAFTGCRIHSHLPYELILSRAFRELSESSIRAFICPSYAVMRYFSRFNFRPTVHLLSFSHFDPKLVSEEPRYGEILSRNGVGYIGRLDKYKGVDDLIKAFKIFSKRHEGFKLLIAGTGPYEGDLRELAQRLGLDSQVEFLGEVRGREKEEFYDSIFCNVVPSRLWENLPFSAQESMLRGIPTVGTRIGGIPELIEDGVTGFTVPVGSPESMAERLEAILRNEGNSVTGMMAMGRERILRNFTPERHLSGLMDIYGRVLGGDEIPDGYDPSPVV
ncbi:glycosyl transferase [Thermogymnomonas acidicola]|uniref:Glycosyl transferase n=1 Tax=Thermogymnomonas acidicola TaxID=399579 RepID=A0AA37F9T0_9ARCH|nr:glycosyltransferase [Thermogymnomonas acidicola]GGM76839.1 glycosyl transferase [Thermogymnomonas acidicola]